MGPGVSAGVAEPACRRRAARRPAPPCALVVSVLALKGFPDIFVVDRGAAVPTRPLLVNSPSKDSCDRASRTEVPFFCT